MSNYDRWKLMTPEENRERFGRSRYSRRHRDPDDEEGAGTPDEPGDQDPPDDRDDSDDGKDDDPDATPVIEGDDPDDHIDLGGES